MIWRSTLGAAVLGAMPLTSLALTPGLCYRPDGTQMDDTYRPCNTNGVSMCCHLAFSNNGGDACGSGPSYGLCGVTGDQLWRESCTDSTWQDPACLQLCVGDGYRGDDAKITKCVDGSYCCGYNNATCCSQGDGVWVVNNQVQLENPSASGSTPSSSSSTTTKMTTTTSTSGAKTTAQTAGTGSEVPTATGPQAESKTTTINGVATTVTAGSSAGGGGGGMSPGMAAGIGVGAAIGAVLLAVGAFFLWKNRNVPGSHNSNLLLSQSPSELMGTPKYSPQPGIAEHHTYCQPWYGHSGPDSTGRYPQEMA